MPTDPDVPPGAGGGVEQELDGEELREFRLTELFSRALQGELAQNSPRKYWETKKLNARHLRIIQMRAAGFKNNEIAEAMEMSPSRVCTVLAQPESRELLAYLIGYAADDVLDVRARIKAVAPEMLEHIVETTRNTRNEKLRSDNAFKILEMAGYKATETKKVEVTARIEGDQAAGLLNALQEAMELEEEIPSTGRFTVLASEAALLESGNISDEPDEEAPSSEQVA